VTGSPDRDPASRTSTGNLRAVHAALTEGADLRGYLAWSLAGQLRWGHGYGQRFGLTTSTTTQQRRVLKDSAHWYRGDPAQRPHLTGLYPAR
jgi:beta-glucosidase